MSELLAIIIVGIVGMVLVVGLVVVSEWIEQKKKDNGKPS